MITAAQLVPEAAELVDRVVAVGPGEIEVIAYRSNGERVTYSLTHSDRDGVEGDAPWSVIVAVEKRIADGDAFAEDEDDCALSPGTYASEAHYEGSL